MAKQEVTKKAKHHRPPQKGHNPESRTGRLRCPKCGEDCKIEIEYGQKVQRCHSCGTSFGLTKVS